MPSANWGVIITIEVPLAREDSGFDRIQLFALWDSSEQ